MMSNGFMLLSIRYTNSIGNVENDAVFRQDISLVYILTECFSAV